jgi:hypothetical protein
VIERGQDHPGGADAGGGHGGGERGRGPQEGLIGKLGQDTLTGDALKPAQEAFGRAWQALETTRALFVIVGVSGVLVLAGAKLERYLEKRKLRVVQGTGADPGEAADAGSGR